MANIKISEFQELTDITGNEYIPVVDSTGDNKKLKSSVLIDELKSEIDNIYLEQVAAYGIEFDTEISSPTCTRIGNMELHRRLPIQSNMRGCLLDDDGNVVEYLPTDDWSESTLDGSKGQVMVEIPKHYRKCETDGTKMRVYISKTELAGYEEIPKMYISAYEATVQRSANKLCSVKNTEADYRGGNNNSEWDGTYRTLLGRPATYIDRKNFRTYARNRNGGATSEWNMLTYETYKAVYWLFVIEYATFNSQLEYNSQITSEGYRQGGLGVGVTMFYPQDWGSFNNYLPFIPCGHTDNLGNKTGVVSYTASNNADISQSFNVPRYRGIENIFGHILKYSDGVNIKSSPDTSTGGDGTSKIFTCKETSKFNDTNYDGYSYVGDLSRKRGYIKNIVFGYYGEIFPQETGGGSTIYFCDSISIIVPSIEILRTIMFGGTSIDNINAGINCTYSIKNTNETDPAHGTRLCFIPNSK